MQVYDSEDGDVEPEILRGMAKCVLFDVQAGEHLKDLEVEKRLSLMENVQDAISLVPPGCTIDAWFQPLQTWTDEQRGALLHYVQMLRSPDRAYRYVEDMLFTEEFFRLIANLVRLKSVHEFFDTNGCVNAKGEFVGSFKNFDKHRWNQKDHGIQTILIPWIIASLKTSTIICPNFIETAMVLCLKLFVVKSRLAVINKDELSYFGWKVLFAVAGEQYIIVDMSPIQNHDQTQDAVSKCRGSRARRKKGKKSKTLKKKRAIKRNVRCEQVAEEEEGKAQAEEDEEDEAEEQQEEAEEVQIVAEKKQKIIECMLCFDQICPDDRYCNPECTCVVFIHKACMSDWNEARKTQGLKPKTCLVCDK